MDYMARCCFYAVVLSILYLNACDSYLASLSVIVLHFKRKNFSTSNLYHILECLKFFSRSN